MISQDESYYEISDNIKIAYDLIFDLQFDAASTVISNIKKDEPQNLLVYHIENYIDFLSLFITEEESLFDSLEQHKHLRLQKIRSGPKDSPYHRFCQAEVMLQWALIRSKFNSGSFIPDVTMINDINKAYRLLEANDQLFPEFRSNKKSLSILHALISYIPSVIKRLFQIKGDLNQGKEEIESLSESSEEPYLFSKEVKAIYAYMLLHLFNDPQKAWITINYEELKHTKSPLAHFLIASIGLKLGKNEEVLEILEARSRRESQIPFYFLDYIEGKAHLHKGNYSKAKQYLTAFVSNFNGIHFIKDAFQKLAWNELIHAGDIDAYKSYMSDIKKYGVSELEDDQQALTEAKAKDIPNRYLLQARLLFDGGYYAEARDILLREHESLYEKKSTKTEYYYRLGRIYQMLERYDLAHEHFSICLSIHHRRSFFRCNAALQRGIIFENQGQISSASAQYTLCKSIKSDKYRAQLHKKAQAGLDRISNKAF